MITANCAKKKSNNKNKGKQTYVLMFFCLALPATYAKKSKNRDFFVANSKKQQTAFSDVSRLKESKGIDGLFGCEILAKQKLLISYKRQELLLID